MKGCRLLIFQVWWPGPERGEFSRERDVRPLAIRPEDISRVRPSGHAGFTEVTVLQSALRDVMENQRAGIEQTIFEFTVEGDFADIVWRINNS